MSATLCNQVDVFWVEYDSDNNHLKHMWKDKYFTHKYFYTYEKV